MIIFFAMGLNTFSNKRIRKIDHAMWNILNAKIALFNLFNFPQIVSSL